MDLPALQIQQPDVGNVLYKAALIRRAKTEDEAAKKKAQQADTTNALADEAGAVGTGFEQTPAFQRLMAIAPDRAQKMIDVASKIDERQRADIDRKTMIAGKLAFSVLDTPPEQQPQAYQQALAAAQQNGLDVSSFPTQWSPLAERRLHTAVIEAQSFKEMMAARKPVVVPQGGMLAQGGKVLVENKKPQATYTPVYGPDGKTIIGQRNSLTQKVETDPRAANNKDAAVMRTVKWLVDNKIYPDQKTAYEATRTRVTMAPAEIRAKGLAWVSSQKDRLGRQVYDTPEKQVAALRAYEKMVAGDIDGALAAFKTLAPKKAAEGPGLIDTIKSIYGRFGSSGAPAAAAGPGNNNSATIQQAKDAIAKGASREAVAERLRKMGIDPAALGQ